MTGHAAARANNADRAMAFLMERHAGRAAA